MSISIRPCTDSADIGAQSARAAVAALSAAQASPDLSTHGDGIVRLVLTGGSGGEAILRQLAELHHSATLQQEDFPITAIDWTRVYVFFGDERFLPHGDAERNDTLADETLLRHVGIPEEHIFRVAAPTVDPSDAGEDETLDQELDAAAQAYATVIAEKAPQGFDLHLLGMGPEGHVNSLFPHREEYLTPEATVVAVRDCPKPPPRRVSFSMPTVQTARRVWLLVPGESKREAVSALLSGEDAAQWPAIAATGSQETVLWVDHAAHPDRAASESSEG